MTDKGKPQVFSSELAEVIPVVAGTGASMQVLLGPDEMPNFAMRRFIMQPGGGAPSHTNTVEHEQYVLQGRAKVGIGDDVHQVAKGDVLFIPPGIPHWYEVEGDEAYEFLCLVPNKPDVIELTDKG